MTLYEISIFNQSKKTINNIFVVFFVGPNVKEKVLAIINGICVLVPLATSSGTFPFLYFQLKFLAFILFVLFIFKSLTFKYMSEFESNDRSID